LEIEVGKERTLKNVGGETGLEKRPWRKTRENDTRSREGLCQKIKKKPRKKWTIEKKCEGGGANLGVGGGKL